MIEDEHDIGRIVQRDPEELDDGGALQLDGRWRRWWRPRRNDDLHTRLDVNLRHRLHGDLQARDAHPHATATAARRADDHERREQP
jgi:hypothetical protein